MPRDRPPYPPEFRAEAVQLYRASGKSLNTITTELRVSLEGFRVWVSAPRSRTAPGPASPPKNAPSSRVFAGRTGCFARSVNC
jgi:transposase-like protein